MYTYTSSCTMDFQRKFFSLAMTKRQYVIISFLFFIILYSPLLMYATPIEDNFVRMFGNEPRMGEWDLIRNWYKEGNGDEKLKKLCVAAHVAGLNETKIMETVTLNERTLKFLDPKYKPMQIDVVKYGIDLEGKDPVKTKKYWWFTKGKTPDCVFYLVPINAQKTEFSPLEYVCNVLYNVTGNNQQT